MNKDSVLQYQKLLTYLSIPKGIQFKVVPHTDMTQRKFIAWPTQGVLPYFLDLRNDQTFFYKKPLEISGDNCEFV